MASLKASCSCREHELIAQDASVTLVHIQKSRSLGKQLLQQLRSENVVGRGAYICTLCLAELRHRHPTTTDTSSSSKKPKLDLKAAIDTVLQLLEAGEVPSESMTDLAEALGASLKHDLYQDSLEALKKYKDSESLQCLNPVDWVDLQNKPLVAFLRGCTGIVRGEHTKKDNALAFTVGQVLHARNLNTVCILGFATNLSLYLATGSRAACSIIGASGPYGSYHTVQAWIRQQSEQAVNCTIPNDVISFYDNAQVVGKTWRVRLGGKVTVSVITSILHLPANFTTSLQEKTDLSPHKWMDLAGERHLQTVQKMETWDRNMEVVFQDFRAKYISQKIEEVLAEAEEPPNTTNPNTTKLTVQPDTDGRLQVKPVGTTRTPTFTVQVDDRHPQESPVGQLGEPYLNNPNSYSRVFDVLKHVATDVIQGARVWSAAGCDGPPYLLGCKLQERCLSCPYCATIIQSGLADFNEHLQTHPDAPTINTQSCFIFGNLLLITGAGHFEMNVTRGLFKLGWHVFLKRLAHHLGFTSTKAQHYCHAAHDHHKSWQILTICLHGCGNELIKQFVGHCRKQCIQPSAPGFDAWSTSLSSCTHKFMTTYIFRYLLALFMYRDGTRRNNSTVMMAGRSVFSALFYGMNMIRYQEIEYRDLATRLNCPEEVSQFMANNESFAENGN